MAALSIQAVAMRHDIQRTMLPALLLAAAVPVTAQYLPMTREGFADAAAQYFAGTDRNHDGKLDREEVAIALGVARVVLKQRREPELFEMDVGPDGRPRLSLNEKGPLGQGGRLDLLFAHVDRDHDGLLSVAEVQTIVRERFDALDRDGSGTLDDRESRVARAQFGGLVRILGGAG